MRPNLYLQKTTSFIARNKRHLAFWGFYIVSATGFNLWRHPQTNLSGVLIVHCCFVAFFYSLLPTVRRFVHKEDRKKTIRQSTLLLGALILAGLFVTERLLPMLGAGVRRTGMAFVWEQFLQHFVLMAIRGTQYAITYVYLQRKVLLERQNGLLLQQQVCKEREMRALEQARLKAAEERNQYMLRLFNAQIHPHLLFNGFSLLQSQALRHGDEQMGDAINTLSSLMDYALQCSKAHVPLVLLQKELGYLEDMIALVRLKWEGNAQVIWDKDGPTRGLTVPPFTLITLFENAIKYGDMGPVHPIRLQLHTSARRLRFSCSNRKKHMPRATDSAGLGLRNIEQRLSSLFPHRYALEIDEDKARFTITLTLDYLANGKTEVHDH